MYKTMSFLWDPGRIESTPKTIHRLVAQSCPTLCHPMECSPPGSSVHGILEVQKLLEVQNVMLEIVHHGYMQLNVTVSHPTIWYHLLKSNELCAIKNGEMQLISVPFESVLRSCGWKYPGYLVLMIHVINFILSLSLFLFSIWKLIIWGWQRGCGLKFFNEFFSVVLYFRPQISNSRLFSKSKHNHGPSERRLVCWILQLALLWGWLGSEFIAFESKRESVTIHSQEGGSKLVMKTLSGRLLLVHRTSSLVWSPCWGRGRVTSKKVLMTR